MPALQTAFPTRQDIGLVGMPALSRYDTDTRVVETAAGIPFGAPIARGANDFGCVVMAAGLTFLGISRRDVSKPPVDLGVYVKGTPLAFFEKASVYVLSDILVTKGDPVFWNPTTLRYSNVVGASNIALPATWVFDTTTTGAGQLVIIVRR